MKRVLVIGDSTVQWIRPYREKISDLTYSESISTKYLTKIISKPGLTSKDSVKIYWNDLAGEYYDICIISVGINDLTPRSYPRWLWKINNDIVVANSLWEKSVSGFYRVVTSTKIQTICAKLGISKPWVSKENFGRNLTKLQEIILKESGAKIIFLSLPMVSKRVKNLFPSIEKNILEYKEILQKLENERTAILDIDKIFERNREEYNPEGIHYSTEGHKKVFEELVKIIEQQFDEN